MNQNTATFLVEKPAAFHLADVSLKGGCKFQFIALVILIAIISGMIAIAIVKGATNG